MFTPLRSYIHNVRLGAPIALAKPNRIRPTPRARLFHSVVTPLTPDATHLDHHSTTEFDSDAGEFVPKEVSIHDRRQTQLSESQKEAARLLDYDGKSSDFASEPSKIQSSYQTFSAKDEKNTKNDSVAEAIENAEDARDQ